MLVTKLSEIISYGILVILKSDGKFNKVLNEPLAKLWEVDENGYWKRLVNTDDQRKILFHSTFKGIQF